MKATEQTVQKTGDQVGYDWKTIGGFGFGVGIVAGIASFFNKDWFSMAIPLGMMIASWLVVNRVSYKRMWSGFIASLLAGIVGWALTLAVAPQGLIDPAMGTTFEAITKLTTVFLVPSILLVGLFGSWVFARSADRIAVSKSKLQEDREKEKEAYLKKIPKRKYKKKKK